jgi:DNA-binding CsgD family transcriptional regulator
MAEGDTRPIHLNEREREVLLLLAEGKTDAEIGIIFNLSAKTINYRVEEIKRKFGVGTRIQAVVTALRRGLIK